MWKYHLKENNICLNSWQTLNSLWTAPGGLLRVLSCQQSADSDKIHPQLNEACMRDVRLECVLITHSTWGDSYPEGTWVLRIMLNSACSRHTHQQNWPHPCWSPAPFEDVEFSQLTALILLCWPTGNLGIHFCLKMSGSANHGHFSFLT